MINLDISLSRRFGQFNSGKWYGLDLPEVIDLHHRLMPEGPRQRLVTSSVLDFGWMDIIAVEQRPVILLAEGVFPYFEEGDRAVSGVLHRRPPLSPSFR
jgi:O-methyltransferase involved in polyketide biosynthesis